MFVITVSVFLAAFDISLSVASYLDMPYVTDFAWRILHTLSNWLCYNIMLFGFMSIIIR